MIVKELFSHSNGSKLILKIQSKLTLHFLNVMTNIRFRQSSSNANLIMICTTTFHLSNREIFRSFIRLFQVKVKRRLTA